METEECRLCGEDIEDVEGMWCFGCKSFICDDHPQSPWGRHDPEAHDTDGLED